MKVKTKLKSRAITKKWLALIGSFGVTKGGDIYFNPNGTSTEAHRWLVFDGMGQWYTPIEMGQQSYWGSAPGIYWDTESMEQVVKCMQVYREYLQT